MAAQSVKIYTTPACVYCRMAKAFFAEKNVKYEELNVQDDLKARQEMFEKSHQMGVPVIDVDGEVYVGFNRSAIGEALGIK